jgi:predicted aspartyl protease
LKRRPRLAKVINRFSDVQTGRRRTPGLTAFADGLRCRPMGKVIVQLKLTNYLDLELKRLKVRKDKPRVVETEALVDTGATRLYLKTSVIKALGLKKQGEVQSKTTNGVRRRAVYSAARLDLMARNGAFEVVEMDDDVPNLLGQIPLEYLDLVVDPKGQKLIPNPEHGDKQMSEEY